MSSYDLSPEELKVLELKIDGKKSREIARRLRVSEALISKYMTSICNKLGFETKARMLYFAAKHIFPKKRSPITVHMTDKEKQVFRLMFEDLSSQEIAALLSISVSTVDNRIHEVCKRANKVSRDHLLAHLTTESFQ